MKQTLIIIGLLVIILIIGTFLTRRKAPSPPPTPEPTLESEPTPPVDADATEVINLLVQQPDIPAGQLSLQLTAKTDTFLKANLGHTYPEAVSGWYVIAVKNDTGWQLVYYGKDLPDCTDVDQWQVPSEIASQCLDQTSGNVVNLAN